MWSNNLNEFFHPSQTELHRTLSGLTGFGAECVYVKAGIWCLFPAPFDRFPTLLMLFMDLDPLEYVICLKVRVLPCRPWVPWVGGITRPSTIWVTRCTVTGGRGSRAGAAGGRIKNGSAPKKSRTRASNKDIFWSIWSTFAVSDSLNTPTLKTYFLLIP